MENRKTIRVGLRITPELYEITKQIAKHDDMTFSKFITDNLDTLVARDHLMGGPILEDEIDISLVDI